MFSLKAWIKCVWFKCFNERQKNDKPDWSHWKEDPCWSLMGLRCQIIITWASVIAIITKQPLAVWGIRGEMALETMEVNPKHIKKNEWAQTTVSNGACNNILCHHC